MLTGSGPESLCGRTFGQSPRLKFGILGENPSALTLRLLEAWVTVASLVIAAPVVMQFFGLLPLLDARVEIIIQGDTPPASNLHSIYIAVDGLKLVLLATVAILTCTRQPVAGTRCQIKTKFSNTISNTRLTVSRGAG